MPDMSPVVDALLAEEKRLQELLDQTPEYRLLKQVRSTIAMYREMGAPERTRVSIEMTRGAGKSRVFGYGEKTKAVEDAAEAFLRERGMRAPASEFVPYMDKAGIPLGGSDPARSLSSFLSTSARFNNVKAWGGYGLAEWGDGPGPNTPGLGQIDPEELALGIAEQAEAEGGFGS